MMQSFDISSTLMDRSFTLRSYFEWLFISHWQPHAADILVAIEHADFHQASG
jgi:hypothetical protein